MTIFIQSVLGSWHWGQDVHGVNMLYIPLCFWAAERKSEVGKGRYMFTPGQNRENTIPEPEALGSSIGCHDQVMSLGSDPSSSFMDESGLPRLQRRAIQDCGVQGACENAVGSEQAQKHLSLSTGDASFWLRLIFSCPKVGSN